MRELVLAVLLALSACAIVIGTAAFATGAAWIVGGLLVGAGSWLLLGEVGE